MDDLLFLLDGDGIFIHYYQPPARPELYVPPEDFLGKSYKQVLPQQVVRLLQPAIEAVANTNRVQQVEYQLETLGGAQWFEAKLSPRRKDSGDFAGVTVVVRNISERKRTEEELRKAREDLEARVKARTAGLLQAKRQLEREVKQRTRTEERLQFLLRELDHRVKNTLATVESVADQTLQSSTSLAEFGEAFRGRIRALARMHEAGAENKWGPLRLGQLVELTMAPFRRSAKRLSARGDAVMLSPVSVRVIGMALHELATNATKYGALSTTDGHVDLSWEVESAQGSDLARITWIESGGPAVMTPSRRGFGTALIEQGIPYELGGEATLQFTTSGVRCEIVVPFPGPAGGP
jgi:two-component sensor histidine kinase